MGTTAVATRGSGVIAQGVDALTGRQKVAVLCLSLGPDLAAQITQRLAVEEVDAISFEIARMGQVDPDTVEGVLEEWMTRILVADSLAAGGLEAAREILEKAFGPRKAQQVLERIQGQLQSSVGLQRLRSVEARQLSTMLREEHPQTVALILAHLDPNHTASVIKELDARAASEAVFRMAKMEKVQPELLQLVERSLSADIDLTMTQGLSASGGPAIVATVLNHLPPSLERVLLEEVAQKDQVLCDQIKNLMFVFEDISSLDERALQRIVRDIELKQLALALKAASADLKAKLTGAMTQRAATALQDEMEMLGAVRLRDVEAAQSAIVAVVRKLEEAGEIVIADDDELVL